MDQTHLNRLQVVAQRLLLKHLRDYIEKEKLTSPIIILIDGIDCTSAAHNSDTSFFGADRKIAQFTPQLRGEKMFMSPEFEYQTRGFKLVMTCRHDSNIYKCLVREREKIEAYADVGMLRMFCSVSKSNQPPEEWLPLG